MVIEPIQGDFVLLRCADVSDVDFTLAIREDKEKTKFLTKFHNTREEQAEWITKQRQAKDSCFFVIENLAGKSLGTIGFYDIDFANKTCESGRYVSWGTPVENLEAVILMLNYIFEKLKIAKSIIYVYPENKQVIHFDKRFGYEYVNDAVMKNDDIGSKFELIPEKYYAKLPKLVALLESAKQKGL